MRFVRYAIVVLLALSGLTLTRAEAQTPAKDAVREALEVLVVHLDECETDGIEPLVSKNIEVLHNTYALRLDGWEALKEHLEAQQESLQEVRTMVRQPSVRIIGTVSVVNFYYTQDCVLSRDTQGSSRDGEAETSPTPERIRELGRGTVVFTKSQVAWKAFSIHLSPMPDPAL